MSDILNEQRLTLTELAQLEGVNACTVWRWTKRGVRGVKLETFSVGGKRFTTQEARARFAAACTIAAQGIEPAAANLTKRQREASIARAERELAKVGV
jgi:hypothetical protein